MITNDRQFEKPPFLLETPIRNFSTQQWCYPALRQGIYEYFRQKPFRRVLLPEYVPQGIHDPFKKLNFEIGYYPVELSLKLKKDQLQRCISDFNPEVFVYIHYFGTYVKENINLLKEILPAQTIFFEDFAHTVPCDTLVYSGDICGFSFSKIAGVAEGSLMIFPRSEPDNDCTYVSESRASKELHTRFRMKLITEHLCSTVTTVPYLQRLVSFFAGKSRHYYPFLMDHYTETMTHVSPSTAKIINRLDFNKIYERRKAIAQHYLERLDSRYLFDLPRECFLAQALYGFPVVVDSQEKFQRFLQQHGVRGFMLKDRWWFKDSRQNSELLHCHYLLPINHTLSDTQVDRIIKAVNSSVIAE
ncbi:MAG: hypothetical protein GF401_15005 [Chitinivibrionales bacterium]|nr:hypothetical protein [Chitinivibrionales bacterium]